MNYSIVHPALPDSAFLGGSFDRGYLNPDGD